MHHVRFRHRSHDPCTLAIKKILRGKQLESTRKYANLLYACNLTGPISACYLSNNITFGGRMVQCNCSDFVIRTVKKAEGHACPYLELPTEFDLYPVSVTGREGYGAGVIMTSLNRYSPCTDGSYPCKNISSLHLHNCLHTKTQKFVQEQ